MKSIAGLMQQLPEGYAAISKEKGAIKRRRGVACAEDLMMLALFHLHNGCTLVEISEIARLTKLGAMSDVAFMKRFEQCGDWFKAINEMLVSQATIHYSKPSWMEGLNVLALDASDVTEKGNSGRTYRLHYVLDIFRMVSVQHKITTNDVGESLCNFVFGENDFIMADRAYSSINGILHCEKSKTKYLLRMRKRSFTVRDARGASIDLVSRLLELKGDDTLDIAAYATNCSGDKALVRICAKKKAPESIEMSRQKIKRKESKKHINYSDDAIMFNDYIVLITNIDESVSAESILQAYRLRWQVEIHFKRLKSILNYGELPKRREASSIAWLNGKIMIALLIEKMISGVIFPPTGYEEPQYLEGDEADCASCNN